MSQPNAQSTPIPTAIRDLWSRVARRTCLMHAEALHIIRSRPTGSEDLRLLPSAVHAEAFAMCQTLIERSCHDELAGIDPANIQQQLNADLWNQLTPLRRDGHHDFVVTRDA